MTVKTTRVGARGVVSHTIKEDPGSAVDPGRLDRTASQIPAGLPLQYVVEWTNSLNERCISYRPSPENAQGFAEGLWVSGYVSATVTVRGGTYNTRRTDR